MAHDALIFVKIFSAICLIGNDSPKLTLSKTSHIGQHISDLLLCHLTVLLDIAMN